MNIPASLKGKVRELPDKPGCYVMRDRRGRIIYVGKAASLRKRVQSYFRQGTLRSAEPKLRGLINSISDVEVIVVKNEAVAALTEGELIKAYRPRYNTFFKDDKRFPILRVDMKQPFPRFDLGRIQRNDGAVYFGPYASSMAARVALEFVEKYFGVRKCRARVPDANDHRHCINDIVRFCAAPCIKGVSVSEYRGRVKEACAFLGGERPGMLKEIETEMKEMSRSLNFEKAAALRDTLRWLRRAGRQRAQLVRICGAAREDALAGVRALRDVLGLSGTPHVIEAYDVSIISGTHAVAGVVVAEDGIARPTRYRRFRIKTDDTVDDARMMAEVIGRRFTRLQGEGGNMPDLVLVDGGVTQLRAAKSELRKLGLFWLPVAGLAKRFEDIYWEDSAVADTGAAKQGGGNVRVITLPPDSSALNVFKRIRDEAHRFALEYHRKLREKKIRESVLDEIPGIGEERKRQLLRRFGSVTRLARAEETAIAAVPGVGPKTAMRIKSILAGNTRVN